MPRTKCGGAIRTWTKNLKNVFTIDLEKENLHSFRCDETRLCKVDGELFKVRRYLCQHAIGRNTGTTGEACGPKNSWTCRCIVDQSKGWVTLQTISAAI